MVVSAIAVLVIPVLVVAVLVIAVLVIAFLVIRNQGSRFYRELAKQPNVLAIGNSAMDVSH